MIELKNMRSGGRMNKPWDYRCDRANKILGNHVGKGMNRLPSIEAFKEFLDIALKAEGTNMVKSEMNKLYFIHQKYGKLNLWCWCTPLPCHTEVIKRKLEEAMEKRK